MNSIALLIDTTTLPAFQQSLREAGHELRGNPDYSALLSTLQQMFPGQLFDPKLAFTAVNFDNVAQKKFVSFLEHQLDFIVDQTDFRDAFVLPDRKSNYQRLSTKMAYVAGLLARRKPHLVAVTDAFEIYYPLLDIVQNREGRATLAFFKSGLEARWERVGLYSGESQIKFIDLDPYASKIICTNLASVQSSASRKTGLGNLRIP